MMIETMSPRKRSPKLIPTILTLAIAAAPTSARGQVTHPDLTLTLSEPGVETKQVRVTGGDDPSQPLKDWRELAAFPADADSYIGTVTDVSVGSSRTALLDGSSEVLVFDSAGRQVAAFGRRGEGPGEIVHGQAVAVANDGTVFVAQRTRVVKVFSPDSQGEYTERSSFPVPGLPYDLCVMGDRLVLRLYHAESKTMLQVYSFDGERERGFGSGYPAGSALAQRTLSEQGQVACVPEQELVVVNWTYQPFLAAFTFAGSQLWHARIDDHAVIPIEEKEGQGLRFTIPESGKLWPTGLAATSAPSRPSGAIALASYSRVGSRGEVVVSVHLDAATGSLVAVDSTLGSYVYGSTIDGALVAAGNVPEPRLVFLRSPVTSDRE